jgi:hypothetical protein
MVAEPGRERTNPMNNSMRWAMAGLVVSLMLTCSSSFAGAEECEGTAMTASLVTLNNSGVTGTAKLCITENGVHTRITANNLTPGNPYTVWFVYFDDPSRCLSPGNCTSADTVMPAADPEGVVGRYDSITAKESTGTFSGHLGMQPSSGSIIVMPIFAHGSLSADGHIRARQLLTPQDPSLGAPGLGTSSDGKKGSPVARAVFAIP